MFSSAPCWTKTWTVSTELVPVTKRTTTGYHKRVAKNTNGLMIRNPGGPSLTHVSAVTKPRTAVHIMVPVPIPTDSVLEAKQALQPTPRMRMEYTKILTHPTGMCMFIPNEKANHYRLTKKPHHQELALGHNISQSSQEQGWTRKRPNFGS